MAASASPSAAAVQSLIPATRITHILRGLGVPEDAAELASTLPPEMAAVVSGAVRVACILNDGAWAASTALNDEEVCDTVVVLASWRETCSQASTALDALLSAPLSSRTPLFPRGTDTEVAFSAFRGILDDAVNRRIARRREYDSLRKRRLDELGASVQTASRVASAVGLGVTALSFCAGASFLPGLLLARSAIAVAGAGVVKSIAGTVPTLAQVRRRDWRPREVWSTDARPRLSPLFAIAVCPSGGRGGAGWCATTVCRNHVTDAGASAGCL